MYMGSASTNPKLGQLLTGIWLVVYGLAQIIELSFKGFPIIMAILAIAAGALLILDR